VSAASLAARVRFAALQADARLQWRLHGSPVFDADAPTGPFRTLVAYLPGSFAHRVGETIISLSGLHEHYRYPPGQLHVTIRNLDGADLATLPELLAGQPPIRLHVSGLGFTRETLLLRFVADGPQLRSLRSQLERLPGTQPQGRSLRGLSFANVLRLNGPLASQLSRSVRAHRKILSGEQLVLDELTLVRTDKVGAPERTESLGRYRLRSQPS
jgi:hypothetical protein